MDYIREHHPEVKIIVNSVNEGFAKGYNTALKQIDAEYFLLLNSDVEVTEGWLDPLIHHLDTSPTTAVCQPKLLWYHHREMFEYAGASGGYIDSLGYPFCRGRIFTSIENDHHQYDQPVNVFWASGACQLVRSSVFWEAGGFDAIFFAHMEEIDLCWRIRNLGMKYFAFHNLKYFTWAEQPYQKTTLAKPISISGTICLCFTKTYPLQKWFRLFSSGYC